MMQNDLALRGPLPIEPAGTMELFAERDNRGEMREPLAPGAVLLRGFAASKAWQRCSKSPRAVRFAS